VVGIHSFMRIKNHKPVKHKAKVSLLRNQHLLIKAPNGYGKTTLLEAIASGTAEGTKVADGVKVGYYRQDFSTLNFDDTAYQSLARAMGQPDEQKLRAVAAGFLLGADILKHTVGSLSEGQKGLVAFARLVLMAPGLLILDEPTNHINFRHLPVIAEALNTYAGAMILVSHDAEFVGKIRIDEVLDLEK
jgi:ATPase subunit of ABC transporter with duplicated ATPase domains